MFRKILMTALIAGVGLTWTSCSKSNESTKCDPIQVSVPQNEINALNAYIEDRNIEAQWDDHGFYYTIIEEGTGVAPNPCSEVIIAYSGKLTNDFVFDQNENIEFPLKSLILGWRLGLPHAKEGGKIVLYLPPHLGYGSRAQNDIPANSILVFEIELKEVK